MRVVSLLPAATEIVALLGATEHLVGVTHECDYPAIVSSRARVTSSAITGSDDAALVDAAVKTLSLQGGAMFTLDEKRIRALRPDLLLTQALCDVCAVREADVRALAERLQPQPRVVTLGGESLGGIYGDIGRVAEAIGAESEGEELLIGLRGRVAHVHAVLEHAGAPRPRVALVEWTSPPFIAGHWGPEQVKRAGGIDVLGTAGQHSVQVSLTALHDADPEIVLIAPCGYDLARSATEAARLLDTPDWSWLAGRQVWALDANGLVSRPGPRVVDGIETMARIFNPALFTSLDSRHAVRVR
ncbi:MAG: ABC transporter substrate-binding protein [Gemmatimonas sp.]